MVKIIQVIEKVFKNITKEERKYYYKFNYIFEKCRVEPIMYYDIDNNFRFSDGFLVSIVFSNEEVRLFKKELDKIYQEFEENIKNIKKPILKIKLNQEIKLFEDLRFKKSFINDLILILQLIKFRKVKNKIDKLYDYYYKREQKVAKIIKKLKKIKKQLELIKKI